MAKAKLNLWLTEYKDLLKKIVKEARNDQEIYETMDISETTYYEYLKNTEFSELIKKAKDERRLNNLDRLVKLHDAMWEKAVGYVSREVIKDVKDGQGHRVSEVTREYSHDTTLMIYLDKTYGTNINADEAKARRDLNKIKIEATRALVESDGASLEKAREILGGIESVIK